MLRRWKERVQHNVRKTLVSSYALIITTLLLGYFLGLIFNPWIGLATFAIGLILTFAWIAWVIS